MNKEERIANICPVMDDGYKVECGREVKNALRDFGWEEADAVTAWLLQDIMKIVEDAYLTGYGRGYGEGISQESVD